MSKSKKPMPQLARNEVIHMLSLTVRLKSSDVVSWSRRAQARSNHTINANTTIGNNAMARILILFMLVVITVRNRIDRAGLRGSAGRIEIQPGYQSINLL
jgi:hypothetical protein